jgi:hypothetical protein
MPLAALVGPRQFRRDLTGGLTPPGFGENGLVATDAPGVRYSVAGRLRTELS